MQAMLTRVGRALGYDVHVAANDRGRVWEGAPLSAQTLDRLPGLGLSDDVAQTVSLIDVLWLTRQSPVTVVAAFEVEKSTSIYSGILRLVDLARSLPNQGTHLYLVAPDGREHEIQAQLCRPAFADLGTPVRYVLFSDLCTHCDGLCTFGGSHHALLKIARTRPSA
jgi:type II restriction enzyme